MQSYVQAGAENGTQWAGPVTPNDPDCGTATTGLMTLGSKKFSFDPFGSISVIAGHVTQNRLDGSAVIAGPGQQGVAFQFSGAIRQPAGAPRVIQGTVTSGQCTWRVLLHRQ